MGKERNRLYIVSFLNFLWYLLSFKRMKVTNVQDFTRRKDKSLADLDNLPDPDILAEEIGENLESALGEF